MTFFCWKLFTTSLALYLLLPSCYSFVRYTHLFYKAFFFFLSAVLPIAMFDWKSMNPSHPSWIAPTWLIHQLALLLHNSLVHLCSKQNAVKWRRKSLWWPDSSERSSEFSHVSRLIHLWDYIFLIFSRCGFLNSHYSLRPFHVSLSNIGFNLFH